MFGTIRKHQTWLLAVIVTITIVSFVVFGPTNTRLSNAMKRGGEGDFGTIGGVPITVEQYRIAKKDLILGEFFRNRQWPTSVDSPEMERGVYQRLFLLAKAKELGVEVTTEAVGKATATMLHGASLDDLADKIRAGGLDEADYLHFMRDEIALEQLQSTAGMCGKLLTPQEAETMYRLENRDVETSLAYFNCSNYMSSVAVNPDNLGKFYTAQMANYRLPEQVQVDCVKFDATNYFAAAEKAITNLTQLVDTNDKNLGTNFFAGTRTREESKAALRKEIIRRSALSLAQVAASKFGEVVFDQPHNIANFESFAAKSNLTVQITKPFDRATGPEEFEVPESFKSAAFSLNSEEPYSSTIRTDDGVYLLALRERFASRTPPLTEIESKVQSDFRFLSALQMAQQEAMNFEAKLTNGLAAGKSYETLCAESGVKPITVPPFSLSSRSVSEDVESKINFNTLKQVAFNVPVGKASPVLTQQQGVFGGAAVIYVAKQLPVDESKLKTELPTFITYVRQVRQNDAFNMWFNNQLRADPDFLTRLQQIMQETQMKSAGRRKS